ncbi:MAG: tryptophanase [Candidatus Hodarchaeales archaeon]|jgi:tryptophanase
MGLKSMHELGIPVPSRKSLVVRMMKNVTIKQRERALRETEYNVFSFPADLLILDLLSDSGSTTMTDIQWSSLFHGDESYGRNKGYYVLLDAVRDTFERGDDRKFAINLILNGESDVEKLMDELYLTNYEGGFVNGGPNQLKRPNAFLTPQGRCAEHLLFSTLFQVLKEIDSDREYFIPNNGHFDTTEANIAANNIHPVNLFSEETIISDFPIDEMGTRNPFKGNMDLDKLENFINVKGSDSIPIIYLTITNNTTAGQPVAMNNIREVKKIADKHGLPLFLDACRFAENAYFIKQFEEGFQDRSIPSIVQEKFQYCDGFTISFKKDGLANMGGGLFFKDRGVFHERFSVNGDIGVRLKEKQILTFGNDSYGGLSGRDIMALATGLYEVVKEPYLRERIGQAREFATKLAHRGIPVILPAGGHAVYINMDKFLEGTDMKNDDFGGVGLTLELIRHYGIRAAELGPFAFEWDKKLPEEREGILNLVRLAIPRNMYGSAHINYAVEAIDQLHRNKHLIPAVKIVRGRELRLRHFQTGLKPIYK